MASRAVDVGDLRLPDPGPDSRLRWDLAQLHAALNEEWQRHGLTWAGLAEQIGCTPSRLTNLRTARMADMALTMRLTPYGADRPGLPGAGHVLGRCSRPVDFCR
jgi:hypothetical protein